MSRPKPSKPGMDQVGMLWAERPSRARGGVVGHWLIISSISVFLPFPSPPYFFPFFIFLLTFFSFPIFPLVLVPFPPFPRRRRAPQMAIGSKYIQMITPPQVRTEPANTPKTTDDVGGLAAVNDRLSRRWSIVVPDDDDRTHPTQAAIKMNAWQRSANWPPPAPRWSSSPEDTGPGPSPRRGGQSRLIRFF